MPKTRPFDRADYLDNPEILAAYLAEALKAGDTLAIGFAEAAVARALARPPKIISTKA
jgi:DNA-binding phage protein